MGQEVPFQPSHGYPTPDGRVSACYTTRDKPLVVTQDDFLVINKFENSHHWYLVLFWSLVLEGGGSVQKYVSYL